MREGDISHYHVLEKLGEGAMGEVYRAEDTRLKRTVALKFLAAGRVTDAGLRQRFLHEAQAAASLDHSNICTVYEVDDQDGEIFLAMAYIDGPTLQKKISQRPLQLGEAVEIAIQIGEGLEAAHERGIVHRDIKSSNILLTSKGQAKITDFGLAMLADQTRLTQTGAIVGTPGYMSPEQARSEAADARSDIWSLGVVLYEMVSGQLPFGGNTAPAAIFAILHREPEPLTALRSGVPLEMDRIVAKALAKNPAQRYQHAADILVDLRSVKRLLESRPQAITVEREPPAREAVVIGQTLGHYQLEEKLGEGGMGIVFRALDTHLGRPAAIKVLKPGKAGAEQKKRFVLEAKAASALNHPNIVHIYDIAESGGVDYIAMEFVEGVTLDRLIPPKGMKLNDALRMAVSVADALGKAHAAGIVHRDLKPSNIMATPDGVVKVLDFGLAKLLEAGAGSTIPLEERPQSDEGMIVGTLAYMSPEQAQGSAVDSRSDIFSFGAVLYEMVTGRRAFQGASRGATMAALLAQEPAAPGALAPGLPPELENAILRCLRKDPRRRWQSFTDLKVVLEDLKEESESGKGVPAGRRRAARIPLWAALLTLGLLIAGAGAAIWWLSRGKSPPQEQRVARMTFDSGRTMFVTASRDGRLMAYASDRSGEGNLDIWVQWVDPAAGRQPVRLTNNPADDWGASLSPDGSRIVFRSNRDGGGLYLLDTLAGEPAGGNARKLVDGGWYPRFSPDGKHVAYVQYSASGLASTNRMFLIPAEGGTPQPFQPEFGALSPPGSFGPVWSPDGKYLLFYGVKPGNPQVTDWWVAPVDGGPPVGAQMQKAILATGTSQPPIAWTPGRIVFLRGSTVEGYNLFSVPIAEKTWVLGQPFRQITSGPGVKFGSALLPGGRMLFDSATAMLQVAAAPFDAGSATAGGEPRGLTRDAAQKFRASVSLDGNTLAFASIGGLERSQRQLRVMNINTGNETAIPLTGSRFFVSPRMNPEGTVLAYTDNMGSKAAGFMVSPDGSGARQICENCSVLDVFPGGTSVLVNEGAAYLKLDPASSQRTPVFSRPPNARVRDTRLSDDGRWLAVLVDKPSGQCGIFMLPMEHLPVAPQDWIPVVENSGWLSCPRIAPGGKWLLYYSDIDGDVCIWARRFDLATRQPAGETRVVLRLRSNSFAVWTPRFELFLEISRDRVFFPLMQATGNIWMTQTDLRQ